MSGTWRWLIVVVVLTAAGCSTTTADVGPRRGGLLTSGGILLGPNVGKDFVGWQGDGHAGL